MHLLILASIEIEKFENLILLIEKGDEAIMVLNPKTGNIIGTMKTLNGRSLTIERCNGKYFLKEYDVKHFPQEEGKIISCFHGFYMN